jgi:hypothetical protein
MKRKKKPSGGAFLVDKEEKKHLVTTRWIFSQRKGNKAFGGHQVPF